jgi:hypothetical protein
MARCVISLRRNSWTLLEGLCCKTLVETTRVTGRQIDLVTAGGLAGYGPDTITQYPPAAGYVDRILKGEKPANLPVQVPTKYELVSLRSRTCLPGNPNCNPALRIPRSRPSAFRPCEPEELPTSLTLNSKDFPAGSVRGAGCCRYRVPMKERHCCGFSRVPLFQRLARLIAFGEQHPF